MDALLTDARMKEEKLVEGCGPIDFPHGLRVNISPVIASGFQD